MSSHVHHPSQAGYDPHQILVDGCAECHLRRLGLPATIMELDPVRFREAWMRAFWWQHDDDTSLKLSRAEMPLLKQLWAMQVALERYFGWPVGSLPENPIPGWAPVQSRGAARVRGPQVSAATGVVEAMVHQAEQMRPPGAEPLTSAEEVEAAIGAEYFEKMTKPRTYTPEDQAKIAALAALPSEACLLCGKDPAAGFATVNSPEATGRLCHGDEESPMTCYHRWTVYGERPQ